jgi:hypothetical protein
VRPTPNDSGLATSTSTSASRLSERSWVALSQLQGAVNLPRRYGRQTEAADFGLRHESTVETQSQARAH